MNKIPYHPKRNLNKIIEQRFNIISIIVLLFFSIISIKLMILQIGQKDEFSVKLDDLTVKLVEGNSVPRGRIYDRNHKLLVDNVGHKVIYYQKPKGITRKAEIELAYKVAQVLDVPYNKLYKTNLKEFWLLINEEEAKNKITAEEYLELKKRKLNQSDIQRLKLERVTDNDLESLNNSDQKAAYLFYLMNKGYYYDEKVIKAENVTELEYAKISENVHKYQGFNTKIEWERKYLYGDTLREVLGSVSDSNQGIPYELKNEYLKKGYALNDRVGLSYLEYQYEDLLKGEKALYKVNKNNTLELVNEGRRGYDLVLTIDIDLQQAVEEIMIDEMKKAKKAPNTEYYNKSFALISNPKTGEILAYASKQIVSKNGEYKIYDYTPYIATTPIVVGSVIKGASMTVGYKTGAIDIGTRMLDECIKIQNTPPKCSWRSGLGVLNDIDALRISSNSYQFKTAIKVASAKYAYNRPLYIDPSAFKTYRDTFAQFGLGVSTEIDLPKESIGYKGGSSVAGHLLDFAIGQYDTYTPIQLLQYINTIANDGARLKLNLLKEIHKQTPNEKIGDLEDEVKPTILNIVDMDEKYINRVQIGFSEVMKGMLGRNYMGIVPKPAGKTGTSESFVDSDGDGKIDKETLTNTFAGYYPYDNPKMSVVVVSPDISHRYNRSSYNVPVNRRITSRICNKYFELFK